LRFILLMLLLLLFSLLFLSAGLSPWGFQVKPFSHHCPFVLGVFFTIMYILHFFIH
jgi:hypothetical protein